MRGRVVDSGGDVTEGPGAGFPELLGHYRLVRRLGAGGMGTVFEAIDRRVDVKVAIKLLHPHLATDESYRERFEREAHVAALLRSPYTVHLLDYGFDQGYSYLVMQFVDGRSVADELRSGPLPARRALEVAIDVARALEEAEARGVVHRDIKPENVLLGNDGSVKVADFGIARQTYSSGVTMPGGFVGTSAFAAPEQVDGPVDTRTDIYALGGTLFTMLTGHQPFNGSALELLRQHRDEPPPVHELGHLPPMVGQTVARCLAKRPSQRFQRPSELVGALERALHDVTSAASAPPTATMIVPPPAASGAMPMPLAGPQGTVVSTPSAGSTGGGLRMELKPQSASNGSRTGVTAYTLTVESQLPRQAEVALRFDDPAGAIAAELPGSLSVPALGSSVVTLRLRPRKRRWFGPRLARTFAVTADGSGSGAPPVTSTGQLDDVPFGAVLVGGGVVGALGLAAAAGLGAADLLGGDGDSPASPTAERSVEARTRVPARTPASSPTPGGSRTVVWTGGGTPTAEQTSVQPTPTTPAAPTPTTRVTVPTATVPAPTATSAPPRLAANSGTWTITLDVTFNNCPFGQTVGGQIEEAYEFYEVANANDYLEPGEAVEAYQTRTGAFLGEYVFSYPQWTISYAIIATDGSPGTAYLSNSFTALNRTVSEIEEYYTTASGPCQIFYG